MPDPTSPPGPSSPDHARVFVGSDRSQLLAVKVLEHSIRRRTSLEVTVRSMHDLDLPDPKDPRQAKRTGFSFTRFAIPQLAGYRGRAVYLDADMLVLRDFRELHDLPFENAKVNIQEELPDGGETWGKPGAPKKRIKQCSVMLLDCGRLDWRAEDIIAGLDGRYTYEELMFDLCILRPEEVRYGVPFHWNSLETYEPGATGLIHYTDMGTQPWVHAGNPHGHLWLDEVRHMLATGALSRAELEEEVARGFFRPSLLPEIDEGREGVPPSADEVTRWRRIDASAGFIPHRAVNEARRRARAAAGGMARARFVAEALANRGRGLLSGLRRRIGAALGTQP